VSFTGAGEFKHRMSRLVIKVRAAAGQGFAADAVANGVYKLGGIRHDGGFDTATGVAGATGAITADWTITASPTDAGGVRTYDMILFPQDLSGSPAAFTATVGGQTFANSATIAPDMQPGKQYTYTITVKKTGLTVGGCTIEGWTDGGGETGDAERVPTYAVGDVYPLVGEPVGVVYEVSDGGLHGRVVSLDQQTPVRWGNNDIDEQAAGVTGIRNSSDGYQGTFNLINKRKDEPDFSTMYGGFYWIYQKNNYDVNGIWYMPAIDELKTLYNVLASVNPKITACGGTEFTYFYYYSSTEFASNGAHLINPESGQVISIPQAFSKAYGNDRCVRAVMKF
jgi:hypothetical protein